MMVLWFSTGKLASIVFLAVYGAGVFLGRITLFKSNRMFVVVFVLKDLAKHWTDMTLLYRLHMGPG